MENDNIGSMFIEESIEHKNGDIEICVKKPLLIFLYLKYIKIRYIASKLNAPGHWNWKKLPREEFITENLSYKLDKLYKEHKEFIDMIKEDAKIALVDHPEEFHDLGLK